MKTLQYQFLDQLTDIYDAERRIANALPKMKKTAISNQMKMEISSLAGETENHLLQMEQIFACFGRTAGGEAFEICQSPPPKSGEIAEFVMSNTNHPALISALQKAGQYEIASYSCLVDWEAVSYGCLLDWANHLGSSESADFLEEIVEEEKSAALPVPVAAGPERERPASANRSRPARTRR